MKELDFAKIGSRLKETRIHRHLTQEYISNYCDVNVSHISNIETGKVKVSLTLLVSICNCLGVTVDYILSDAYSFANTATEHELLNIVHGMEPAKQEQLLRIASVL